MTEALQPEPLFPHPPTIPHSNQSVISPHNADPWGDDFGIIDYKILSPSLRIRYGLPAKTMNTLTKEHKRREKTQPQPEKGVAE